MLHTVLGYNGLYPGYKIQKFLTEKASPGQQRSVKKHLNLTNKDLTCQKLESLGFLRSMGQITIRQRVRVFPSSVSKRGQSQMLHEEFLQAE